MLKKEKEERMQMEMICMDELVPEDHLLRKIDDAVDFNRIYDFVEDLYCHNNGRPSIDPVVLFKMVLIQHLFGIPSLRKTAEEVSLKYSTTNRNGYREFKSNGLVCQNCPSRNTCTNNAKCEKTVAKHIWNDYLEIAEDIRHTPKYKKLYEKRKETIERVFADAKEKYSMHYTLYRGLAQITNWVRLKFAAMNLKKYAIRKWNKDGKERFQLCFCPLLQFFCYV